MLTYVGSDMVVTGVTPPFVLFRALTLLGTILSQVLYLAAWLSIVFLVFGLLPYWMLRPIPRRGRSGCRRYVKTAFLFVGRRLCVQVFPVLFKMHKTRSDNGSQMRSFMVFLDRKVDRSLPVVAAFCSIVFSIFSSSVTVFFQYFPLEKSEDCLEKDKHGRSLFCYRNSGLVDCANYSTTELRELPFVCYAIALPGFGIAVAAAHGLAKVAIVGVTICVKVTEGYFKLTNDHPQILSRWFCGCRRQCANGTYGALSFLLFCIILPSLSYFTLTFIILHIHTGLDLNLLYDLDILSFPVLVFYPLWYIILYLETHCDKGEYISIAADMRPPDQRDWDMESEASVTEREQDKASNGGESGNIDEEAPTDIEETLLIEARSNVEYTEFGATHL